MGFLLVVLIAKPLGPGKLDYLFLIHKNLDLHAGGKSVFIIHYDRKRVS